MDAKRSGKRVWDTTDVGESRRLRVMTGDAVSPAPLPRHLTCSRRVAPQPGATTSSTRWRGASRPSRTAGGAAGGAAGAGARVVGGSVVAAGVLTGLPLRGGTTGS